RWPLQRRFFKGDQAAYVSWHPHGNERLLTRQRLIVYLFVELEHAVGTQTGRIQEVAATVLLVGRPAAAVLDAVGPAIGAFAIEVVVAESALVMLGILAEPVLGVLVFAPAGHLVGLQPLAIAPVVAPLADVHIVVAIPLGTPAMAQ